MSMNPLLLLKAALSDEQLLKITEHFDSEFYQTYHRGSRDECIAHFLSVGAYQGCNPNKHFDCSFYLERYSFVKRKRRNPLIDWIRVGKRAGRYRNPIEYEIETIRNSSLFDKRYYIRNNKEIESAHRDPIAHFVKVGCHQGQKPCEWFEPEFYLSYYEDVQRSGRSPFVHYIEFGQKENRLCNERAYHIDLINRSIYFDEGYYSSRVSIPKKMSAAEHFYQSGTTPKANPSKYFDCRIYLEENPEAKRADISPLLHWMLKGNGINPIGVPYDSDFECEIIKRSNLFDDNFYTKTYPDIDFSQTAPIRHFVLCGAREGKHPFKGFDSDFYSFYYSDVQHNPLVHWIVRGKFERRFINQAEKDAHVIRQSDIFDTEYYLANNPDVKKAGVDPIQHFVAHGADEGRKPCQWFDSQFYRLQYKDVLKSRRNPLAHYIEVGRKEGRETAEIINDVIAFKSLQFPRLVDKKIAVLIHGYYDDLIEELLDYTRNIKCEYDILLSVTSEKGKKIASLWAKKFDPSGRLIVKTAPNKGRDLAPALVTFSKEIPNYSYVCKIHTKKSLYTGKDQSHWRKELISPLLGSEETVNNILSLFEESENLGVVYPECKSFPYWAYTWLSNKGSGTALMEKLEINLPVSGYIDYPLGTMFWFQPSALWQLFKGRITLDDFLEEPIPNDGTIAHALERIPILMAKYNSYTYAEVDLLNRQFHYGFGSKNFTQYTSKTVELARQQIENVDIVSFDIFDTLIARPLLSPDSLFDLIEQEIDSRYEIHSRFHFSRKEAERLARKRLKKDVNYHEIYDEMASEKILDENVVHYARQREFQFECEITRPRSKVIELLNFAHQIGKRVILVSDMYLTTPQVSRLLNLNNIAGYDQLYLSSELGLRKDIGTMWDFLVKQEGLNETNFIHFGDNEHSDIQLSGDRRLKNFHVMSATNMFYNSDAGMQLQKICVDSGFASVAFGPIVERIYANPFIEKKQHRLNKKFTSPFQTGFMALGPPVLHFMLWLIARVTHRENSPIFFLAREGHFLREIYDYISVHPQIKKIFPLLPRSEYLLISRRAVLGALNKDAHSLKEIIEGNTFEGTVDELVQHRFGFTVPEQYMDVKLERIGIPQDIEKTMLLLKPMFAAMQQCAQTERTALLEYLSKIGFIDSDKSVVVDLGYAGTIQRYLGELTNQKIDGYYFATNDKTRKWTTPTNNSYGCFENEALTDTRSPVYRFSLLLEAWLTSPVGQLTHFSKENGTIQPHFKPLESPESLFHINEQITQGVIAYIKDVLDLCGENINQVFNDAVSYDVQAMFEQAVRYDLWDDESRKIFHLENDFCGLPDFDIVNHYKSILNKSILK